METTFNLQKFNDLLREIEEKGLAIINEVEIFLEKIKIKKEMYRVKRLINEEYIKMGSLIYDLNRLSKDIDIKDFEENCKYVADQEKYFNQLSEAYEKLVRLYPGEETMEEGNDISYKEDNPDYIRCPSCKSLNSIYSAQCIHCGENL